MTDFCLFQFLYVLNVFTIVVKIKKFTIQPLAARHDSNKTCIELKEMKNNKAPGQDGFTVEVFKNLMIGPLFLEKCEPCI